MDQIKGENSRRLSIIISHDVFLQEVEPLAVSRVCGRNSHDILDSECCREEKNENIKFFNKEKNMISCDKRRLCKDLHSTANHLSCTFFMNLMRAGQNLTTCKGILKQTFIINRFLHYSIVYYILVHYSIVSCLQILQ